MHIVYNVVVVILECRSLSSPREVRTIGNNKKAAAVRNSAVVPRLHYGFHRSHTHALIPQITETSKQTLASVSHTVEVVLAAWLTRWSRLVL